MRMGSLALPALLLIAQPALPVDAHEIPFAASENAEVTAASPLHGNDANHDGIRDDIAALMRGQPVEIADPPASAVEREIVAAAQAPSPKPKPRGSRCLAYLLMEPEDQADANLYLQGHANGVFGSHPCDPVVSPLIDRPLDHNFVELPLGPVVIDYAKYD